MHPKRDQSRERLITILLRPLRGVPIDSKVFRPMITACPIVSRRKRFKSSGNRQGMALLRPIVRLRANAATMETLDGEGTALLY
jgi:hypothetical protein